MLFPPHAANFDDPKMDELRDRNAEELARSHQIKTIFLSFAEGLSGSQFKKQNMATVIRCLVWSFQRVKVNLRRSQIFPATTIEANAY
jgi:hypothetical protein